MAEIAKVRGTNGYTMVSTFSGCGGSCLGFEMAGYHVVWANEFVEAARNSYRPNHPDTYLCENDIREVNADTIYRDIGGKREIDVFEGSPPCASFSTVGVTDKHWGKVKGYSDTSQRTDDLFFEYSRLLRELKPKVFVAENVKGLIRGVAKGYFKVIMRELRECGYRVKAQLLDSKWLGVPQRRERLIFIGVREDLELDPVYPKPLQHQVTVREAIHDLVDGEVWLMGQGRGRFEHVDQPTRTITCNGYVGSWTEQSVQIKRGGELLPYRQFTIPECRRLCGFPDDFELVGSDRQKWERLGRAVPPVMMFHVAKTLQTEVLDKL